MQEQQAGANTPYIILISIVATIGGFLFGYDSGVINGTVDGLQIAFDSDSIGTGFNVASMLLGCAIGAFSAGRLADGYGRRNIMRVAAVFFIISAWGSGVAGSSLEFVIYRVLGGLAVGAASVLAPAYISEVAPARYRGALTTVQQVAIICGINAAFVSNFFLARSAGSSTTEFWMGFEAWRWMFWMELIPAGLFLVLLFAIPESPRFLVIKRRREEAAAVLKKLFGAVVAQQAGIAAPQSRELGRRGRHDQVGEGLAQGRERRRAQHLDRRDRQGQVDVAPQAVGIGHQPAVQRQLAGERQEDLAPGEGQAAGAGSPGQGDGLVAQAQGGDSDTVAGAGAQPGPVRLPGGCQNVGVARAPSGAEQGGTPVALQALDHRHGPLLFQAELLGGLDRQGKGRRRRHHGDRLPRGGRPDGGGPAGDGEQQEDKYGRPLHGAE